MADTIVLMNKGVIQQEAPPEEMYRDPNNLFVAQFIGVPPMNISNLGVDHVKFGFRPEKLILSTSPIESYFSIKGRIVTREMLGSETIYQIRYNDTSFMAKSTEDKYQVDQDINVGVQAEDIFFFGENEERIRSDYPNFQSYLEKLREY